MVIISFNLNSSKSSLHIQTRNFKIIIKAQNYYSKLWKNVTLNCKKYF